MPLFGIKFTNVIIFLYLQLKKELEDIKLKLGQQITTPVLDSKEGLLESCKEEECGVNEIKEEFSLAQVILKKEEDLEVNYLFKQLI